MIFVLHYLLFNAGLPTVIILITLFLQTYSDASLSEIGTLLMALPFVSILIKPLFGALADRHQAHRLYLMGSLAVMALGYGSLAIAPFFPQFIKEHGRLVWYLDVLSIIVGYSAFGIIWSLGDALAVNGAQMANTSWGYYRMWGVVAWGSAGILAGQINELPFLPKFVPAFFLLVACLVVEILLLAFWPNKYFIMGGSLSNSDAQPQGGGSPLGNKANDKRQSNDLNATYQCDHEFADWPNSRSLTGTLKGNGTLNGTPSAKMMGAVANILMDDLGGTLRSSLTLSSKSRRRGLSEILDEHQKKMNAAAAAAATACESSVQPASSGQPLETAANERPIDSPASLRKHQLAISGTVDELPSKAAERAKSSEDLQLVLLKFLIMRDKTIGKFLVLFTIFGFLLTCHLSYFYMHVEHLCREKGNDFASVMGGMLATHSISEMLAFIFVPAYITRVGRIGALLTCSLAYFLRFAYYGTYFIDNSPYTGIPFEFCHGIAYGIVYTLITDIACECVNQIDEFLPELIERKLVTPDTQIHQLKSALRATMQGVFSGAFDGLGNGMGALFGGVFLDSFPFIRLWQSCAIISLAVMVVYPIIEWRPSGKRTEKEQYISNLPAGCSIDVNQFKELDKVADGAK